MLDKNQTLCTNNKWLVNSPEDPYIVALSVELFKTKDTNLKLAKVFKHKGTPKEKDNK